MSRGIVTKIARAAGTVEWAEYPFPPPSEPAPSPRVSAYLGEPPAPWTECLFTNDGAYCLGSLAPPEEVFHDDFCRVVAPGYGDGNWIQRGTLGTLHQQSDGQPEEGALRLVSSAVAGTWLGVSKDNRALLLPSSPEALWLSGRLAIWTAAGTPLYICGFSDATWGGGAAQQECYLTYDPGLFGHGRLALASVVTGGASIFTDTGFAPANLVYFDFDLVLQPGTFASLDIGGGGPVVTFQPPAPAAPSLPAAGALSTVVFTGYPRAAAAVLFKADWLRLARVPSVVSPSTVPA